MTKALNPSGLRSEAIAATLAAQPNMTCEGHAAIVTASPSEVPGSCSMLLVGRRAGGPTLRSGDARAITGSPTGKALSVPSRTRNRG